MTQLSGRDFLSRPEGASFRRRVIAAAIFFLLLPTPALAQFSAGVQGNVDDPSGAKIPQAQLTLTNTATNVSRIVSSDESGYFRFLSVAPGNYRLTATAKDFAEANVTFVLVAGELRNVPFVLAVATEATKVSVTTEARLVDTSDIPLQPRLDQTALENLPLFSRNPTALITLTPG